jgi:hypothetical protein
MDYETCRQTLQTGINETIAAWLKTVDMKPWESARQIDIVLKRISNMIRSKEANHE